MQAERRKSTRLGRSPENAVFVARPSASLFPAYSESPLGRRSAYGRGGRSAMIVHAPSSCVGSARSDQAFTAAGI